MTKMSDLRKAFIPASIRCKLCSTCHVERPLRDFRRTTLIKGGYELTCNICYMRIKSEMKHESRLSVALNSLDDILARKPDD